MLEKLNGRNLVASYYDNGLYELEFNVDGLNVMVSYITVDGEVDEFYWDKEENIRKVVDNADDNDFSYV